MESVAKFKKWHSERMGHPIGVLLAVEAIGGLEHRINDLDSCAKVSNSRVVELKKYNDRLVEENAELREHLANLVTESIALAQFKNDTLRKGICSTDLDEPEWHDYQTIGEAGAYLELLNK